MFTASRGWLALIAGVVAFEVVAADGELLSEGFDRLLARHPVWPRIIVGVVAAHLINFLPERVDPVHWLTYVRRGRRVRPPECEGTCTVLKLSSGTAN